MKRSPIRRGTGLRRETELQQKSTRRKAEDRLWARVRASTWERDAGTCQGIGVAPGPCWGSLEPHHVWPVGRGGPRCDPHNVTWLCAACHDWAHGNPLAAKEASLLR